MARTDIAAQHVVNGQASESAITSGVESGAAENSAVQYSATSILERLKERDREDEQMLLVIERRLAELAAERDELLRARLKLTRAVTVTPIVNGAVAGASAPEELSVRKQILRALAANPKGVSTAELSATIRAPTSDTVRQSLYDMASKAKTVERAGRAFWRITPKGRDALQGGAD